MTVKKKKCNQNKAHFVVYIFIRATCVLYDVCVIIRTKCISHTRHINCITSKGWGEEGGEEKRITNFRPTPRPENVSSRKPRDGSKPDFRLGFPGDKKKKNPKRFLPNGNQTGRPEKINTVDEIIARRRRRRGFRARGTDGRNNKNIITRKTTLFRRHKN